MTSFTGLTFTDLEARRAQLEHAIDVMPEGTPEHVLAGMQADLDRVTAEMAEGW